MSIANLIIAPKQKKAPKYLFLCQEDGLQICRDMRNQGRLLYTSKAIKVAIILAFLKNKYYNTGCPTLLI